MHVLPPFSRAMQGPHSTRPALPALVLPADGPGALAGFIMTKHAYELTEAGPDKLKETVLKAWADYMEVRWTWFGGQVSLAGWCSNRTWKLERRAGCMEVFLCTHGVAVFALRQLGYGCNTVNVAVPLVPSLC